jgi:hypothetical protein
MVPLHIHKGFWQHASWDPTLVVNYMCILKNNALKLTPYRFGFKCDTDRIRKCFLPGPKYVAGSPG